MQLTKHPSGSLREVWTLSLPLMFSCLSSYLMWFIDRFFLTYYSIEGLNATVTASALSWGFLGGSAVMAGMVELFVAQYNGAGLQKKIGESVWQMIWFSFFTILIFLPLGILGSTFFYDSHSMEASYFRWTMIFGFLQPLIYTLTSFFVGRGKIKGVVILAIFITCFHIVVDKMLIFGVSTWLPELGVKGAAIASCLTLSIQAAILLFYFLKPKNREVFGTNLWKFNFKVFLKLSKITAPPAILYNIEQLGWALFYSLMTIASPTHITISSLCQSLILLFSFFGDGLARGSGVIANNYVGAGNKSLVRKVLKSSTYILIIFFSIQVLILKFKPSFFISSFLPTAQEMELFGVSLESSLWFVLLFLLFQGFQWVLSSLLYASGESFFVMLTGSLSIWLFLILPSYLFVVRQGMSVMWAWAFVAFYGLISTLIYLWKLKSHDKDKRIPIETSPKLGFE